MSTEWINALFGGALIGVAVSLMLLWNGRVTGISGIINGVLTPAKGDTLWRIQFLLGLFFGGLVLQQLNPQTIYNSLIQSQLSIVIAGLLVGFGTILGSGCTSGHGVCGISRLSPRSLSATIAFMLSGVLTVFLLRKFGAI
jgi:uncharacterized membrane protein YedE/YeeE